MCKKKEWLGKARRGVAIALITVMTLPGLTAYADEPIRSDDGEHDECYVDVILNTSAGESWEYEGEIIRLPDGYVGESYGNHELKCETCGLKPVVWGLYSFDEYPEMQLPEGMAVSNQGRLSGIPREEGEYQFTVWVEAGDEEASPSDAHLESSAYGEMTYFITIQPKRGTDDKNNNNNSNDRDDSDSGSGSGYTNGRKPGWNLEGENWYYYVRTSSGGLQLLKGWVQDPQDNFWYFLDLETGKMVTGWHEIGGKRYYFTEQTLVSGWEAVGDEWRYKNTEGSRPKGSMYSNEMTPDGHMVGEDGAMIS